MAEDDRGTRTERPATVTKCSFCGKGVDDVRKLIAGGDAAICDECVDACVDVLIREGYGWWHFTSWWRRFRGA